MVGTPRRSVDDFCASRLTAVFTSLRQMIFGHLLYANFKKRQIVAESNSIRGLEQFLFNRFEVVRCWVRDFFEYPLKAICPQELPASNTDLLNAICEGKQAITGANWYSVLFVLGVYR